MNAAMRLVSFCLFSSALAGRISVPNAVFETKIGMEEDDPPSKAVEFRFGDVHKSRSELFGQALAGYMLTLNIRDMPDVAKQSTTLRMECTSCKHKIIAWVQQKARHWNQSDTILPSTKTMLAKSLTELNKLLAPMVIDSVFKAAGYEGGLDEAIRGEQTTEPEIQSTKLAKAVEGFKALMGYSLCMSGFSIASMRDTCFEEAREFSLMYSMCMVQADDKAVTCQSSRDGQNVLKLDLEGIPNTNYGFGSKSWCHVAEVGPYSDSSAKGIYKGDDIMALANRLCEFFGFTHMRLEDAAAKPCNTIAGDSIRTSISDSAMVRKGEGYYMRFGYVPCPYDPALNSIHKGDARTHGSPLQVQDLFCKGAKTLKAMQIKDWLATLNTFQRDGLTDRNRMREVGATFESYFSETLKLANESARQFEEPCAPTSTVSACAEAVLSSGKRNPYLSCSAARELEEIFFTPWDEIAVASLTTTKDTSLSGNENAIVVLTQYNLMCRVSDPGSEYAMPPSVNFKNYCNGIPVGQACGKLFKCGPTAACKNKVCCLKAGAKTTTKTLCCSRRLSTIDQNKCGT